MYVINVGSGYQWEATYILGKPSERLAKEYALECAREQFSCNMPETVDELEVGECGAYMKVLSSDAELML